MIDEREARDYQLHSSTLCILPIDVQLNMAAFVYSTTDALSQCIIILSTCSSRKSPL